MRVRFLVSIAALVSVVLGSGAHAGEVREGRRLTGANSKCGQSRVRKSWNMYTATEKNLYKEAVTLAMKSGEFFEFSKIHMDHTSEMQAHSTCAFLNWHKRYLLAYENMLRSQGSKYACVTIPYWDAAREYADMADGKCNNIYDCSPILQELGGKPTNKQTAVQFNGETIYGICHDSFAGEAYCDQKGQCGCFVRGNTRNMKMPSGCGYTTLFNQIAFSRNFDEFTKAIQFGAHNELHSYVGGVMASFASPNDPIFWSWHAAIDMYLYIYHQCHVPSAMTDEQMKESVYGFTQTGECKYNPSAPDAYIHSKLIQQSTNAGEQRSAETNELIGKYFEDLGDKVADFTTFRGLGEYSYHYRIPGAFKKELLENENFCRTYWKGWQDSKKVEPDEVTVKPGTVAPPTDKPEDKDDKDDKDDKKDDKHDKKDDKDDKKTKKPSTKVPDVLSDSSSSGADDSDEVIILPGVLEPEQVGSSDSDVATGVATEGPVFTTDRPTVVEVECEEDHEPEQSKYWGWFKKSCDKLQEVYPGNITEIAKQLDCLGCMTFSAEFGIANFSEEFRQHFKVNQTEPQCQIQVDEVQEGKKEVAIETESFEPEQVEIKPGVTPAPAVNPDDVYKQFQHSSGEKKFEDAEKTQKDSSASSMTVLSTTLSLAVVAMLVNWV